VQHWLANHDIKARISIIWLPMLESDDRPAAESARTMFERDARVVQFWDPERLAGTRWSVEYQVAHGRAALDSLPPEDEIRARIEAWVQAPAGLVMWDVAYFYRRGMRWRDRVPAPIAWTKQVGFWGTVPDSISASIPNESTGEFWCHRRPHAVVESDWFSEFASGMTIAIP
jgi:hypothetical protein